MAWQVLTGVVEWWADEGLRDLGRRRGRPAPEEPVTRGTIDVARAAFAARRHPWRLSQISLAPPGEGVAPAVASWADDATAVLVGSPAEQRVVGAGERWGDLGLRRMLEPGALAAVVARPWPAAFSVPGERLEQDASLLPELLTLATDRYDVVYDADLDVLERWTAVIGDEVAQRISLSHLTAPAP